MLQVSNYFQSKYLQRHSKIMSIYDYFMLGDTSFNQKYFFISVVCEFLSKNMIYNILFLWHKTYSVVVRIPQQLFE